MGNSSVSVIDDARVDARSEVESVTGPWFPLHGVRIFDFTWEATGPFATQRWGAAAPES
jgi:hypothetical protein